MSVAGVVPFRPKDAGDWMMGGSGDPEGERRFGFGPHEVAQLAVMAYGDVRSACKPDTDRETFTHSVLLVLEELVCERAGVERLPVEVVDA